ncbi:MAG: FAD-dependent oxidoreductase [Xanthobacteraceae bacterium]|nr:FAD-dependent oxidoreductase [Xanthobacteraceae bacterium]
MTMTRRRFLSATAALGAAAVWPGRGSAAPLPREADIVVIGAGAAGIAAARRIAAAKRTVVVIEAMDRVGGRCVTDAATFAVPFDRGARWLYGADANPMIRLARGAGLEVAPTPPGQKLRIGRRNARAGETEDFLASLVRANRAIDDAARGKADVAAAEALPKDLGDWAGTVAFVLGPDATGKDLRDLSVRDLSRGRDRLAPIGCRQGIGALVAKLAEGLPVALSTPAQRVVWSRREVGVETAMGRIAARAAIVTVSPDVLLSDRIAFTPGLPKRQFEAAGRLGLGSLDRIALQLPGNPLGLSREEIVIERSTDRRTASLVADVGDSLLCTVDVAGGFGRELSAQGEAAMVAFARDWLGSLYGGDAVARVEKSAATRWNAAPYIRGAISAAAPGGQPSRGLLAEPFGNVFIAGEATHETLWGTVDGAWESGVRAADAALKAIGPEKAVVPPHKQKPRRRRRRAR